MKTTLIRPLLLFVVVSVTMTSTCGPLPRSGNFYRSIEKWPVSAAATGLVMFASDSTYASTDIYFYNFGSGELSPLATGESGDAVGRWDGRRFWLFNRAAGRVSYSALSPKSGPSSRGVERRTPDGNAGDPTDWLHVSDVESLLALGATGKVKVANLANGTPLASDLGDVDTSVDGIPFRPGVLWRIGGEVAVFHQSLDTTWKARGGGRIFITRQLGASGWTWVDQDELTSGIQGVRLSVSDPITVFDCDGETCLIAGGCYETSGDQCVGGVDQWTVATRSVVHRFDWPSGFVVAGGVSQGVVTGEVIACLKDLSGGNARLVTMDAMSGLQLASWDAGAASCAPFEVDRDGKRVFAVKKNGGVSELYALSADLTEIAHVSPGLNISDLEMINE